MNNSELRASLLKNHGEIQIMDHKKSISEIVKRLIIMKFLRSCGGSFYLAVEHLLTPITEREAIAIIRALLSEADRINISSNEIKEALERAKDAPELQIDIDDIHSKTKDKLLTLNGEFDALTGKYRAPAKDSLYLYKLNFNYKEGAKLEEAPSFMKFADTSLGNENLDCALEWMAYICTSLTEARKSAFFIGPEQCGKSLLLDVIEDALGPDNTSAVPFSKLGTEQSRIKYQGKIANLSRETSAEPMRNDDAFKRIIAGDKITGRRLYENSVEFVCFAKFTTASNHFPVFKHMDSATLDRIIPIYFKDRVIDEVQTDFHLKEKLLKEKDIIFSVALDKLPGLISSGYQFSLSDRSKEVLAQKRIELLNVKEFLKDNFEIVPDGVISSVELYRFYQEWCDANGISSEGRNTFYSKVTDYSSSIKRGKNNIGGRLLNSFKGLKLRSNYSEKKYVHSYQDSQTSTQPQKGGEPK